jgi:hypothetical protein
MISKDRRSSRRFLLKLPLTIRWNNDGVVHNASTESQDVSICGLYFHLPRELKSGLSVEIVMTLPNGMTALTHGRILRSSPEHSGNVGVAAAIERFEPLPNALDEFEIRRKEFFGL